jgi:hypothetical protein
MMKFEQVPGAAPLTAIDGAQQGSLADGGRELAAAMSVCHLASRPMPARRGRSTPNDNFATSGEITSMKEGYRWRASS